MHHGTIGGITIKSWTMSKIVYLPFICIHSYIHLEILGIFRQQTINYNSYNMWAVHSEESSRGNFPPPTQHPVKKNVTNFM
jgi:hypothetical protein